MQWSSESGQGLPVGRNRVSVEGSYAPVNHVASPANGVISNPK